MRQIHWRKKGTRYEHIEKDIYYKEVLIGEFIYYKPMAITESSQVLQSMISRAMRVEFQVKASGPGSSRCPRIISRLMLSKLETQEEPAIQSES